MNNSEYNSLILNLVKAYIEINPEQKFNQTLNNLGVSTSLFHEQTEKTYLKVKANFDTALKNLEGK